MQLKRSLVLYFAVMVVGLTLGAPFASPKSFGAFAQNRISGYVLGINRQPMTDLNVELMDEYNRTVGRTRTNGSGYYTFSGMRSGRFTIRVYTFGTNYEEHENSVEIINFTNGTTGQVGGFTSEQSDFNLRLRRGFVPENVVVFAQVIPEDAKKLYEKAIEDLNNQRSNEGMEELRAAVEIFPNYYLALERLGTEYIQMGRPEAFQAAEILLALAVGINPRGFVSWYGLAYSRYTLGKYDNGLSAVEKAVALNANSPDAVSLYGVLLRRTKKYSDAEKQLIKAVEVSKDTLPRVHWELALLYGNDLKRYADAAKELRLFLLAQPDAKDSEMIKKLIVDFDRKAKEK